MKEFGRMVKFTLFSISAGVIQIGTYTLFYEVFHWAPWLAYLVSLILSVLWNFTFNRTYTFRSDADIRKSMLLVALVIDPLIIAVSLHTNPYPLVLKCIRESGLTAFFTRSSAANIPVNLSLCERLGLNSDTYSISIPLGATINMSGAAITIAVLSLAAAHTMGIAVDLPTALLLCIVSTVGACGASGVAGGSLLLIPYLSFSFSPLTQPL